MEYTRNERMDIDRLPPQSITYEYFCILGGLQNPFCSTRAVYLGNKYHHTVYYYQTPIYPNVECEESWRLRNFGKLDIL